MLDDDMDYVVRVMSDECRGSDSDFLDELVCRCGPESTRFANTRPQFSRDTFTLNVEENTPSNRSIGRPVAATDDDGHNLTYTLEGVHKDRVHDRERQRAYTDPRGRSTTSRGADTR